jgi:hypothetical protein
MCDLELTRQPKNFAVDLRVSYLEISRKFLGSRFALQYILECDASLVDFGLNLFLFSRHEVSDLGHLKKDHPHLG